MKNSPKKENGTESEKEKDQENDKNEKEKDKEKERTNKRKRNLASDDMKDDNNDIKTMAISKASVQSVKLVKSNSSWDDFRFNEGSKEKLLKQIKEVMGLEKPTTMQSKAIPYLLQNRDVLLQAETGSGKTLAYLIPMVNDLTGERVSRGDGTKALIIVPTRELSLQIWQVLRTLTIKSFHYLTSGTCMGGSEKKKEKVGLRKGLSIVIGTPGRILDHMNNTKAFHFEQLQWLILDEADRLLDLGFEKDVQEILQFIRNRGMVPRYIIIIILFIFGKENSMCQIDLYVRRCNVLVSATLSGGVNRLAELSLSNPVRIGLQKNEALDSTSSAENSKYFVPETLTHQYLCVNRRSKSLALIGLLLILQKRFHKEKKCLFELGECLTRQGLKVVIFLSTCSAVNYFYQLFSQVSLSPTRRELILKNLEGKSDNEKTPQSESSDLTLEMKPDGKHAAAIKDVTLTHDKQAAAHLINGWFELRGDMSQSDRTCTYFAFCNANRGVLLTTDVAARGLDIPGVDWIIQFDPPPRLQDYIHRVNVQFKLRYC
ncbi:dead box ATP-dependent RNA helicase [Reticulomyxa filosa]|uniref:ATP-dependent RNA helicase n=1 Tax=Reticulomyxa filosa TaxID=46433 RepID=X6MT61_RETFI|nr:dead box ATP-dependent RNA helicase [Reticulomyxa filosa]|eukprot:ETO16642.1 dead box ATP-dependent RNA helicase [Reticulomyxa filosa]